MTRQKVNRSEVFWEQTRSLCPECRRVIEAQILFRDNRVIMRKHCPAHGRFEALIFGDAELYAEIARSSKSSTLPLEFATEVKEGCPHDCGLCPDHQQHACLAVIEVNSACNLDCPLCFADAGSHGHRNGFELTFEQVNFMLDRFVAAEGQPEVIQFSGGEPSLHPRLLDFVELARGKGIEYVMINSNGIRIARDDKFLAGLARLKPHVYLQFDGFDQATNRALRGRPNLIEEKLRALDRLAEADVRVVLVATIERGVNEHEIGPIVEFGLGHPAVFGVNFQPVFRVQRHLPADPLTRVTIPDVLGALEASTDGLFRLADFIPVSCCAPTCHFVTYALLDGDAVLPIPRLIEVEQYMDHIENRTVPRLSDDLVRMLERLWSASAVAGSGRLAAGVRRVLLSGVKMSGDDDAAGLMEWLINPELAPPACRTRERCPACQAYRPLSAHAPRDLGRHIFMVSVRDFMDPWTFDIRDVMQCCVAFLVPDGRIVPFCAYNSVGYREQVRQTLAVTPAKV